MKKFLTILPVVLLIAAITVLSAFTFSGISTSDDLVYREAFRRNYKMFTVEMPAHLDFAGEPIPLDKYYVRESFDKELHVNAYWHSSTVLMMKRANRWRPVIEPILKKNNIPADFFYLCLIESGMENVVSPAGAAGFWQIMKSPAQAYGLEISSEVDERYNVEKATEAACRILRDAYEKFHSWSLAAVSYNMGMGGLERALNTQRTRNFYDLQLNRETIRYMYRIVAIKTIFEHPVSYGFYIRIRDLYPHIPTEPFITDSTIPDFGKFCQDKNISYRVLKEMNPWILTNSLLNKERKSYKIQLPKDGVVSVDKLLEDLSEPDQLFNDTLHVRDI